MILTIWNGVLSPPPPSYGISYRDNREVEIEFETKSVLGIRPC